MKRLILGLLLLLLVILSVPPLRARAAPRFAALGSAIWDRIEGPLAPVLNPWRSINTKSEIARITNELILRRNQGRPAPRPEELQDFIAERGASADGFDAWGSPYTLDSSPDSVFVRSPGSDLEVGTEDDIIVSVRYPSRDRRGRGRR